MLEIERQKIAAVRMTAWLESTADIHATDLVPSRFDAAVPLALAQARRACEPAQNSDTVVEALLSLAERKGVQMPSGPTWQVEVMEMASWPPDLFIKAFTQVATSHVYPRLPYCGEFKAVIQADLDERRSRLAALDTLSRKIQRRDRDATVRREAEWMERGRDLPTQAELDAVAAIKQQVHRHLTTPPSAPAAASPPPPADPRCDHASPDQPPPTAQSGTP
jgi:hypothetical protein